MYVETKKVNALLAAGTYAMQVNRDQGYRQGVRYACMHKVRMWGCGNVGNFGTLGSWGTGKWDWMVWVGMGLVV